MSISEPFLLGVDGVQCTGKGTLISQVLVPYFQELGYTILVMKGAGSRTGDGKEDGIFYNPEDSFRTDLRPQLYATKPNEPASLQCRERAAVKLQQELTHVITSRPNLDCIILDRTVFTLNAMRNLINPDETIHQTARYYEEIYKTSLYMPHFVFSFYASDPQVLFDRVYPTSPDAAFKNSFIAQNHVFNTALYAIQQSRGRDKIEVLDTAQPLNHIHAHVRDVLDSLQIRKRHS